MDVCMRVRVIIIRVWQRIESSLESVDNCLSDWIIWNDSWRGSTTRSKPFFPIWGIYVFFLVFFFLPASFNLFASHQCVPRLLWTCFKIYSEFLLEFQSKVFKVPSLFQSVLTNSGCFALHGILAPLTGFITRWTSKNQRTTCIKRQKWPL